MKKRVIAALSLAMCMLIFSSCSMQRADESRQSSVYNGLTNQWIVESRNYIYRKINVNPEMISKADSKAYDILRDPFPEENFMSLGYIFTDDENTYYLYETTEGYKIIKRDDNTLSEKIIYQKTNKKVQKEIFMGAAQTKHANYLEQSQQRVPNCFCIIKNSLFLFDNYETIKVDLKTGKEKKIYEKSIYNYNFSCIGDKLYFIDSAYDICCYDLKAEKLSKLEGKKAQTLLLTDSGIYYSSAADKGNMYFTDFEGKTNKKLTDIFVSSMDFKNGKIYFVNEGDGILYRMNDDGTQLTEFYKKAQLFDLKCTEKGIYILFNDDNGEIQTDVIDY